MKRTIYTLLALTLCLLTLLPLSGCKKEEAGLLRILMDVPDQRNPYKMKSSFEEFLELVEEKGGPTDIEVEWMPQEGEERKGALTRLRTEVMAGRGPDLFIIVEDWWKEDPLFPYPEKSMMNGLFLKLDKYMEKSQFSEWEYQNETILAAGRTDKGQYIIPMTYSLPVTCFREGDTDHVPDPSHNWKEMAGSADLTEQITCFGTAAAAHQIAGWGNNHLCDALGKLADFDTEELLFTEEDLEYCIKKKLEVMDASEQQGTFDSLPAFFQAPLCPGFLNWSQHGLAFGAAEEELIPQDEPMTIVPQYSIQGGSAAYIKSYTMIGNYTKRPKDAWFLLDLFMGREVQNGSFVTGKDAADGVGIGYVCYSGTESGLPLDNRNVSIPTANQEAVAAVLKTITQVNYYDSLYNTLAHLMLDCENIRTGWTEGDMDELIHETYRELAMSVKES